MHDNYRDKGMSPLAAGLVGLMVGAVGAVLAIALSDEETRRRLREKAREIENKGTEAFSQIRQKGMRVKEKAMSEIQDMANEKNQKRK